MHRIDIGGGQDWLRPNHLKYACVGSPKPIKVSMGLLWKCVTSDITGKNVPLGRYFFISKAFSEHNSRTMSNQPRHSDRLLQLARQKGLLRPSDLAALGIPRVYLTRLTAGGKLAKTGRGLYRLTEAPSRRVKVWPSWRHGRRKPFFACSRLCSSTS